MSINSTYSKRRILTHPNSQSHNWLIYRNLENHLFGNEALFKGTIYDLGAGYAPYRVYFSNLAHEYITVDWEQSSHPEAPEILADLNKPLPISTSSADTVLSISVLEHLSDPALMLRETFRILKPGGHLVLQTPWQWKTHEAPYDYYRYSYYGLRHLLTNSGYTEISISAQSGFFTTWLLKFNYFTSRASKRGSIISRIFGKAIIPIWYVNQWAAPFLDKLDSNWNAETSGFFVTARKP